MFKESDFRDTKVSICYVKSDYLKYIRKFDIRIPVKTNRKFIGLVIFINGMQYVVPLTSKSTFERIDKGKKKRSPLVTTNLKNVADILHNNMFPVPMKELEKINDISFEKDSYLNYEYRLIRKKWATINLKSMNIYRNRYDEQNRDYYFLKRICCDFKKLEEECKGWTYDHLMINLKNKNISKEFLEIENEQDLLTYFDLSEYVDHLKVDNLSNSNELQVIKITIFDEYGQSKSKNVLVKLITKEPVNS